eukprot:sb/3462689/
MSLTQVSDIFISGPDLPGCSGQKVLSGKSGCPVNQVMESENELQKKGDMAYMACYLFEYTTLAVDRTDCLHITTFPHREFKTSTSLSSSTYNEDSADYLHPTNDQEGWRTSLNISSVSVTEEGKYTCTFTFVRDSETSLEKTIERVVWLDVGREFLTPYLVSDIFISGPDLPGCSGQKVLSGKSGCPVNQVMESENELQKKGDMAYMACYLFEYTTLAVDRTDWEFKTSTSLSSSTYNEDSADYLHPVRDVGEEGWRTSLNISSVTVTEEGKYTCTFTFVRDTETSLEKTIERVVWLDVGRMEVQPTTKFVEEDENAVFKCRARVAEGNSGARVIPTYQWYVNGETGHGTITGGGDGADSVFTVVATRARDFGKVKCIATYDQVATSDSTANVETITSNEVILYSKRVVALPDDTVHYAEGIDIEITCKYNSYHDGAQTRWYYNSAEITTGHADYTSKKSITDNVETYTLAIKNPNAARYATHKVYTCIVEFPASEGANWEGRITMGNSYDVARPTFVNNHHATYSGITASLISGYVQQPIRACYLGHVIGYQPIRDQCFLIRSVPVQFFDYVWYADTSAVDTTSGGSSDSDTYTDSQIMYSERSLSYKTVITWHLPKQTLTKTSPTMSVPMQDSCAVNYNNIDGTITKEKVDTSKPPFVVQGTVIDILLDLIRKYWSLIG